MSDAIPFHPLANIFPLLEGDEFAALTGDIRAQGQREPILLYEDSILDGRNRYRACLAAGVEPTFVQYEGDDATAIVISLNLRRRHLDTSQRAMVATKLANLPAYRPDGSVGIPTLTQSAAAEMLNVGRESVIHARTVQREGAPELVREVERGNVSVSAAAEVARLPVEQQAEVVAAGPIAVREAARDIREGRFVHRTSFTGNNQWFTPVEYIDAAREVFGSIDVDPASNPIAQSTVQASTFYTEETNGLDKEWNGNVWLNPPYSQPEIGYFIDKLVEEVASGRTKQAIMLTHNSSDTKWFKKAASVSTALCLTYGRVRFINEQDERAAPTQGQSFLYFGPDPEKFDQVFSELGSVWHRQVAAQ